MNISMMEELAPKAFYTVAEELGLADDLLMDAEVVFVEEAKADLARMYADLDRSHFEHVAFDRPRTLADPETFMRDWARSLMVKVLCRLETRPHDQFRALSA